MRPPGTPAFMKSPPGAPGDVPPIGDEEEKVQSQEEKRRNQPPSRKPGSSSDNHVSMSQQVRAPMKPRGSVGEQVSLAGSFTENQGSRLTASKRKRSTIPRSSTTAFSTIKPIGTSSVGQFRRTSWVGRSVGGRHVRTSMSSLKTDSRQDVDESWGEWPEQKACSSANTQVSYGRNVAG